MPSLSPQRSRKVAQSPLGQQGPMQNITPREMTPSPSFREKQRAIKAHSMPTVPSLGQVLATQGVQLMYPQAQQPSPTASNSSHQSRRSPPPTSRISPTAAKIPTQAERNPERQNTPPPALHHAHSTPVVPLMPNQSVPNPHHPRPVPRGAPPAFLSQFQGADDRWAVTEELMAEFEHYNTHSGTAGVAYAGGAASNGLKRRDSLNAPAKDPAVERVRAADRASPKESDSGGSQVAKRQVWDKERDVQAARESPKTRERSGTVSSQHAGDAHVRTPEYRGSPQYQTPMASPGERTASYTQYVQEGYQAPPQSATQTVPRKPVPTVVGPDSNPTRLTPPAASKLATTTHTPPLQVMGTRPPDRSLPLQEPEEDNGHEYDNDEQEYEDRHHGSPTPSSDLYPEGHPTRYDNRHERRDDDDETLNDDGDDNDHVQQNKSSEDSEAGFTPRSPSTTLPERSRDSPYGPTINQYAENQKTIRAKHRGGSTDQIGMRNFDPTLFERETVNTLRSAGQEVPNSAQRERVSQSPPQVAPQPQPEPPRQQQPLPQQLYDQRLHAMDLNRILDQRAGYGWNLSSTQSDDMQSLFDDPTSSYLQTFLRSSSARPGAPIPPTPQSHAAPSPSPLISAMPSDFETRQIGSPYPYPFTHIRRSTVSGPLQAPSTSYDMNNPAVIREQMALQMQIYALNNGLAAPSSESAFSPSSTPFPGPNYNPWAFVPAGGGLGLNGAAASIRSSPSHEPVNLPPPPPMRGRGMRHQNGHMRPQYTARPVRRMKPPPRVDSTQPRETSPEPSSGEETAGEERFVDQYVREIEGGVNGKGTLVGNWDDAEMTPQGDDDGEWVDEEEEGQEEDLLDLEYHPTYVSNPQRRRRRFDTRWDALVQTFQALDRETDAMLVLLAAPSHSSKLHALTSRALRRDPALANSTALASVRRSFSHLSAQRRAARKAQRMSLAERLSSRSDSSADGSPGTPGEMDLRRALETALGSLGALSAIYEQREARWRDEMRRLSEDRERVELLVKQALGQNVMDGGMNGHHSLPGAQ